MKFKKIFLAFCLQLVLFSMSSSSLACTRLLHVDQKQGIMVGRNMDWFQDMETNLIVYPRGIEREGNDPINALKWTSKYGSIVAAYHDISSTDGMNEKGFSAHILWLAESDYGVRNPTLPGLSLLLWTQFYLDNFATVNDALLYTQAHPFQLLPFFDPFSHMDMKLHLALEDATGDSAIIEYINGMPVVYHSAEFHVMTNDPTYDVQLNNLHQYQLLGGDKSIPGTDSASDRLVRAAYHEKNLPAENSVDDEVHDVLSILENVSHPHEYFRGTTAVAGTIWRSISDLTHRVYYFNSTKEYTLNFTRLDGFDLNVGAPVMKLDLVRNSGLNGDVTSLFK